MAKPTIVTRAGKGSALTWTEGDANLTNLRDATITVKAGTGGTDVVSDLNGTVTLVAGSNVTITGDNTAKTVSISASAGGATNLDGLTDVTITSPSSNQLLTYNGSAWINQSPSSGALDDLSDVTITSPSNGQALVYNSSTFQWTNQTVSGSGITDVVQDTTPQLGGNLDVQTYSINTSATNGNVTLAANGTGHIYATSRLRTGTIANNFSGTTPSGGRVVLGTANAEVTAATGGVALLSGPAAQISTTGTGITMLAAGTGTVTIDSYTSTSVSGTTTLSLTAGTNLTLANSAGTSTWPTSMGSNGYVLTTNGTGTLSWAAPSGGSLALDNLTDVVITAAATDDILRFDGTNWVDTAASSITVGTATVANTVALVATNTTAAAHYLTFVDTATGNENVRTDTDLTYNPSTNTLTAGNFSGTLSGTATNVSGTVALANGGTGQTSAPAAMAALIGYTSTATAAGTTVLSNTSTHYQIFTGSTTQTITLPVTSTLVTGWTFHICNNSTGNLTVNSSGGNLVITVLPGTTAMATCILTSGTTAASWEAGLTDFSTATGTGSVVLGTSPSISGLTLTGSLTAGGSAGTSGQLLQTTGSGIQWASAPTNKIILGSSDTLGRFTLANSNNTASTSTFTLITAGGVSGVSVSTNTFTLPAGTYYFYVPGLVTTSYNSPDRRSNIKLYNSTDAADTQTWGNFQSVTLGGSTYYTWNNLTAYFTIAASKTFQIRTASIPTGSSSSTAPVIVHNNESTNEKFMFFIEKVA